MKKPINKVLTKRGNINEKDDTIDIIDGKINAMAKQDQKNELLEIKNQIKNIFINKFGNWVVYRSIGKIIRSAKPKKYQLIIDQLSKLLLSDEEFAEVIELTQTYRNIKNNTPEQRQAWEILSAMIQLFLQEVTQTLPSQEIAKMWKKVQSLFNEWLNKPNEMLENEKPQDVLKVYFPDQNFTKIWIKWVFIKN